MQPMKLSVSIEILSGMAAQAAVIKKSKAIKAEHFWLGLSNMMLIPFHELGPLIPDKNFLENLRIEIMAVREEMVKIKLNPRVFHAYLDSKIVTGTDAVQISQLERDVSGYQIFEDAHKIAVEHQANTLLLWHFFQAMIAAPPENVHEALKQSGVDLSKAAYGDVGEQVSANPSPDSFFAPQVKTILTAMDKSQNIVLAFEDIRLKSRILESVAYAIHEQKLSVELVGISDKYKPSALNRSGIEELKEWIGSVKSNKSLYFVLPLYREIAESNFARGYLEIWDSAKHGFVLCVNESELQELSLTKKYRTIYINEVKQESIPNQL